MNHKLELWIDRKLMALSDSTFDRIVSKIEKIYTKLYLWKIECRYRIFGDMTKEMDENWKIIPNPTFFRDLRRGVLEMWEVAR